MRRCVKIKVTGKVHAVGYRKFVQKHANSLEVEGTVQNMENGSVMIYVCGDVDKVDDFIDFLYKGPERAKVKDVLVEPMPVEKDFRGVFRKIGSN